MATDPLQRVAEAVVRRARQQGYVVPKDLRAELRLAGLEESNWKLVLEHVRNELVYRQGRYYLLTTMSPRVRETQTQQNAIQKAIRDILRHHRARQRESERRGQKRVELIVPAILTLEDGQTHRLMSRDLSPTGIRLLGTKRLLGQKLQLTLQLEGDQPTLRLLVRILWTCSVGDDLFENGGTFLEILP